MAGTWVADRRLVLAPDRSRVLGPGEDQSGFLLAPAGGLVAEAACRRYSLGPYAPEVKQVEPTEDKMVARPPEDKAIVSSANKRPRGRPRKEI